MSTGPPTGERPEKKGTGIGTKDEAQTRVLAGTMGIRMGGAIGVEVGAEIDLTDRRSPVAPGSGSPQISVSVGVTEASSAAR